MPNVRPETPGHEAAARVRGCPVEPRTGPLLRGVVGRDGGVALLFGEEGVLVRLERVLLVVGGELKGDVDEGERGEGVVPDGQRRAGLLHGDESGGDGEHEQEDVLNAGCRNV